MAGTECNYQRKMTARELTTALSEAECRHCRVSAAALLENGEHLEICAEEFASDIMSGERVLTPIALCPACHRLNHLDAHHRHNPCQIKARHSRENSF
ncbi:hypothetical protein OEZ60_05350 [Defluviimonas sp. WL0024]|uniref:HNH endonuclease n=2 Tax=Albidovulum TaxID=205889 RepID=A0ABT3J1P5_9RHOB|nr:MULTISPECIES: hypothetical protein [Defluviimonas]MCU9847425.1 hypothetical protein [Defluviimonas sp. WL0024]MCW3781617.1 hypothetical protein [Defluviimonas salinarum]